MGTTSWTYNIQEIEQNLQPYKRKIFGHVFVLLHDRTLLLYHITTGQVLQEISIMIYI